MPNCGKNILCEVRQKKNSNKRATRGQKKKKMPSDQAENQNTEHIFQDIS